MRDRILVNACVERAHIHSTQPLKTNSQSNFILFGALFFTISMIVVVIHISLGCLFSSYNVFCLISCSSAIYSCLCLMDGNSEWLSFSHHMSGSTFMMFLLYSFVQESSIWYDCKCVCMSVGAIEFRRAIRHCYEFYYGLVVKC